LCQITEAYAGKLVNGTNAGTEATRRHVVASLNYDYDTFLKSGQAILEGRDPLDPPPDPPGLISIPLSENMRLAAGGGGTALIFDDSDAGPIIVHSSVLGRSTARNLRAFRVGGDSMEPTIPQGAIVVVDSADRGPDRLKEGKIYMLCWNLLEEECAVKRLRWAEKGRLLMILSPNQDTPMIKPLSEVNIVGRVIWFCSSLD
jgi:hypothetical protein